MEIFVLDQNLQTFAVFDSYESIIWTDRYFKCGDFEIYTSMTDDIFNNLKQDNYLWINGSEHVMIIEEINIDTDVEKGSHFKATGRSLESILDRRIVWVQTILSGNFQEGIHQLLDNNVINPAIASRKINNFVFEASTDPAITALTIEAQFTGDNLYETIQKLCEANNIGFKITLTDNGLFKFKLYSGVDRSYKQFATPYVVFSPKFENIINSNYVESKKALKTVTLVAGEGEGAERKTTSVEIDGGGGTGLSRRETFTDARDVSSKVDKKVLTDAEYKAQLAQRGVKDLSEKIFVKSFEGKVDTTNMYKYGEDFFMGDILQIANEYGMEARARVIELIHSQNLDSTDVYPTFIQVE